MAGEGRDARVAIDGDDNGLKAAVASATSTMRGFSSQVTGEFDRMAAGAAKVQTAFVGIGAAILAGGAFKAAVDTSVQLTKEANSLSKALGITATEASVLNVALGDIYTDAETLIGANSKLTRALKENEEAFGNLGVETRDSNGQFRGSLDIMLDVNKRLLEFKEGTDRNIEGSKIYGKSWSEVQPILKLTTDLMEESRKKATELGLVVGEENVAATAKYRAAMNDVHDVLMAAKKAIGDAVMPVLTELGEWFAATGPQRVEYTRKAIAVVIAALYGFKSGVETTFTFVKGYVQGAVVTWVTFAEAASQALKLDFAGARATWQRGMDQVRTIASDTMNKMAEDAAKNREKIFGALFQGFEGPTTTPTRAKGGGAGSSGGDKKDKADKSRLDEFENMLVQEKLILDRENQMRGTDYDFKKARERDFWAEILARKDLTDKERMQVEKKFLDSSKAVRKEDHETYLAELKTALEAFTNNMEARRTVALTIAKQIADTKGRETKEYQAALQELQSIDQKALAQKLEINKLQVEAQRNDRLADIDMRVKDAELAVQLGQMTQRQLIEVQRQAAREKMEIELEAQQAEIEAMKGNPNHDPVALEKQLQQLNEIRRRYKTQDKDLENKGTVEDNKPFQKIFGGMQQSASLFMNGFLTQSRNVASQFLAIWRNMAVQWVAQVVGRMVQQWVLGEALKTTATETGVAQRLVAEQGASQTSIMMQAGDILKKIFNFAAETFAGIFAFLSGVMGPAAAGPAAAGMGAVNAIAGSVIASASGGFDIPKFANPLTQLHPEEMVLPAPLANAVRNMTGEGGAAGGGDVHHWNISAVDAAGVEQFFRRNGPALARTLAGQRRNFSTGRK